MKSNEEYLDELLRALEEDDNIDSALNKGSPDDALEENDGDGNEDWLDGAVEETEENAADLGSLPEDIMESMPEDSLPSILGNELDDSFEEVFEERVEDDLYDFDHQDYELLESDEEEIDFGEAVTVNHPRTITKEELEGLERVLKETETLEKEDDLSASSLEKLMAEIQDSTEDIEEDYFSGDDILSEESIDDLLKAAKEKTVATQQTVPRNSDFSELDYEEDDNLSEIKQLFDMADQGKFADELELPLEEEQVFSMEDLDSLLEDHSEQVSEEPESKANKKEFQKNKKDKEKSGLGKFLSLLFEEESEDMEPKEASDLNLSQENKEILTQLDKEERKKKKAKPKKEKGKKKKGELAEEEGNNPKKKAKKVTKPKKEKKAKKEKEVKAEVVVEKPEKLLPKKKVIVTSIFAASVLIAILFLEYLIPPVLTLASARESYEQQEYGKAYQGYYGEKLNEADVERFETSRAVLRMKTNLDSYHGFLKMGDEVKALHYLLEGVHVKDDVYALAGSYGATAEVDAVYTEILSILSNEYGLAENQAVDLVNESSDLVYTKKLHALVEGTEYVDPKLEVVVSPETTVDSADSEALLVEDGQEADGSDGTMEGVSTNEGTTEPVIEEIISTDSAAEVGAVVQDTTGTETKANVIVVE